MRTLSVLWRFDGVDIGGEVGTLFARKHIESFFPQQT